MDGIEYPMEMDGIKSAMVRSTLYEVVAHDRDGNELWRESVPNLVTTAGLNDSPDEAF